MTQLKRGKAQITMWIPKYKFYSILKGKVTVARDIMAMAARSAWTYFEALEHFEENALAKIASNRVCS